MVLCSAVSVRECLSVSVLAVGALLTFQRHSGTTCSCISVLRLLTLSCDMIVRNLTDCRGESVNTESLTGS